MLMHSTKDLSAAAPIPPWGLADSEMICRNCTHWDTAATEEMGISPLRQLGICDCMAIEPDAGHGALVLLGPESHCRCHAAEFRASQAFLSMLSEAEDARNVA